MKYKSQIYAKALADLMMDEKLNDKKIADNFLKLLGKNKDLKNAKKIVELAQIYYLAKKGNKKILLEMARPLAATPVAKGNLGAARKTKAENILKFLFKTGDIIEEKINPEVIAGIKIIVNNEKQLDFSLRRKLDKIFS